MGRKPVIVRHISNVELDQLYKDEKNIRIKERLLAIIQLYEGKNIYVVAYLLKRSEKTIKNWLSDWNKQGYEGLIPQNRNSKEPMISLMNGIKLLKKLRAKE